MFELINMFKPNTEKSENSPISWTEWTILINVCLNIDIDKI